MNLWRPSARFRQHEFDPELDAKPMSETLTTLEPMCAEPLAAPGPPDLPRLKLTGRHALTTSVWAKVLLVLAIPVFSCVLAFFLVGSQIFQRYADPLWVRASDQIYTARNVHCEIVLFGDSTAITGIDPKIIEAATHLRTCNLAQTKGVLAVLGTSGLDMYLRNNPRPQILLIQFAGQDFYHPGSWRDTGAYMEGVVPMLRFYPRRQFVTALLHHPEIYMGMMHFAYLTGPMNLLRNRLRRQVPQHSAEVPIDVHLVMPQPAFKSCKGVEDIDPMFHAPDATFIRELREHYGALAGNVVLDAAPDSACDPRLDFLENTLVGLDNRVRPYPAQLFNEGYEHYTAQGAARLSASIARQLEPLAAAAQQKPAQSETVAVREPNQPHRQKP